MNSSDREQPDDTQELLSSIGGQLRRLTVAIVVMVLVLALLTMSVYGHLVNYFAAEPLMYGSTLGGATLVGFCFGWFARGRR
jgi:hypothetical protein